MKKIDLYKMLGIDRNASKEQVRQAYKNRAKETHPDMNNGNKEKEEEFKEVHQAYLILSDPSKRTRYDNTGELGGENKQKKIISFVQTIIVKILGSVEDIDTLDLMKTIDKIIKKTISGINERINSTEKQIVKLEKFKKRLKRKSKSKKPDYIEMLLNNELETGKHSVNSLKEEKKFVEECKEFFLEYSYDFETKKEEQNFTRHRGGNSWEEMIRGHMEEM